MVACRMKEASYPHQPVLLTEVLQNLVIDSSGIYVDATFGRGGHTQAILQQLSPTGRLLAIDKDPEAIAYARQHFSSDKRFTIQQGSFAELTPFLQRENVYGKINGIFFDLGVSSPQLDDPNRGFSFMRNGKLDMRMDFSQGLDAASWLAVVSEETLSKILWEYGEERFARRIARAIVTARAVEPIVTTHRLAEIVAAAIPAWQKGKHPATRSFQAIRIEINQELDHLKKGLDQALTALKTGGRLLVISFHSLEDRIVKQFMQHHASGPQFPAKLPVKHTSYTPAFKRVGSAVKAALKEIAANTRARSAILRILEKLS